MKMLSFPEGGGGANVMTGPKWKCFFLQRNMNHASKFPSCDLYISNNNHKVLYHILQVVTAVNCSKTTHLDFGQIMKYLPPLQSSVLAQFIRVKLLCLG